MPVKARLYVYLVIAAGAILLWQQFGGWHAPIAEHYGWYLLLGVLTARLKISLPSSPGGLAIFFVFVLYGIMVFSLPETLFLAFLATLVQSSDSLRRFDVHQLLFNLGNMELATAVAYQAYHFLLLGPHQAETALTLVVAASVFFAMNTFPVAVVIAWSEHSSLPKVWRAGYFWSYPYYLFGAGAAGIVELVSRTSGWQTSLLVVPFFYLAYRSYAMYLVRTQEEKKHAQDMAALYLRTIEALALAIDAKDQNTHDHLRRVQIYAMEVGKELGLPKMEMEALRAAALLHDIGKLAIPEHIVSKPGKLTLEEFEKMKIHPVVGAEILERVGFPYPVIPIVRSHHERWNGSGYPDGLKGEEIPVGARILAAVDCLDALASERSYHRKLSLRDAMQKVVAESGVSFDPRVVSILERRGPELEKIVQLSSQPGVPLSTRARVARGEQPAAGLEEQTPSVAPPAKPADFLSSIAAASQEAHTLFELAQDLGNSLSINETLMLIAGRIKRMIACDTLAVFLPDGDALQPMHVSGENHRLFSSLRIPPGQGVSGWVAENGKPILNGNPAAETSYLKDDTVATGMCSALSVPLTGDSGLAGVLSLYHAEKDAFTKDHLRILLAITPIVARAIENALKYQQVESSAATDYMTGLPNARSLFLHLDSELARCRRTNTPLVVLVCDMNGFKQVNDRFGHLEGNRLLREVSAKLKESCREYDYVARMGGDEFVLILPGLTLEQVQPKALRLRAITKEAGQEVCGIDTIGLSIGHAIYPDDGADAELLLSEADRRMYAAKQKEKARLSEPRGFDFDAMLAR